MTKHSDSAEITEAPFGSEKRDWVTAWRVVILICSLVSGVGVATAIYAGSSYIEKTATEVIDKKIAPISDLPPRVQSLEKMAVERAEFVRNFDLWKSRKDEVDTQLLTVIQTQQKQIDRQQDQIDEMLKRKSSGG